MAENTDKMISDEISDKIVDIAEAIAIKDGVKNISVRRILREMNVTNRVFYNRFHNLNEVLEIIYKRAVFKMHECIKSEFDLKTDFFNYAVDVSTKVLVCTYKVKNQFSQFMFEHDSYSDANRNWWTKKNFQSIRNRCSFHGNHLYCCCINYPSYTYYCNSCSIC